MLLIVAHGERGGEGRDRFAHDLAKDLAGSPEFSSAMACFVSKEPSLKSVYSALPQGPVVVYPLFMSDGYFVKNAIPQSLGREGQDFRQNTVVLQPVGIHPQLAGVVSDLACSAADAACQTPGDCRLLLVAHGSRHGKASRRATEAVAAAIVKLQTFADVKVSFLEECPYLDEQLGRVDGPLIAAGLFAGEGMHGTEDLQAAVAGSKRSDLIVAPPLARSSGLFNLAKEDLRDQLAARLQQVAPYNRKVL